VDGEGGSCLFSQAWTAMVAATSSPRRERRWWQRPLLPGANDDGGDGLFSHARTVTMAAASSPRRGGRWERGEGSVAVAVTGNRGPSQPGLGGGEVDLISRGGDLTSRGWR
jgi:hypothetical protein